MSECGRELTWAGGTHRFDLGAEPVLKMLGAGPAPMPFDLVQFCGPGAILRGQFGDTPAACFRRFEENVYSLEDVERIVALGLYGGGMPAAKAVALVKEHVVGKPLGKNAVLAYEILAALFVGAASPADSASSANLPT